MNATAMRPCGPLRMASITRASEKAAAHPERCRSNFELIHAARNVGGQHEKEIDGLGGAAGRPACRCHQRGKHERSHSAHYVGTVLLCCEQSGLLSFLSNRIKRQWRSYGGTRPWQRLRLFHERHRHLAKCSSCVVTEPSSRPRTPPSPLVPMMMCVTCSSRATRSIVSAIPPRSERVT